MLNAKMFCSAFYMDGSRGTAITTGIFIAAAVTDWLDGYLARKVAIRFLSEEQDYFFKGF